MTEFNGIFATKNEYGQNDKNSPPYQYWQCQNDLPAPRRLPMAKQGKMFKDTQ
jgi:hypothetical protein